MATLLSGRCYCGKVEYTVADEFRYAANCHCSNCRRVTGSAFKPFAGNESNHNAHCRACGSLLYSLVRNGAYVHVAMGTLTANPSIRPTEHIFVGSKALWHEITDTLPQYQEFG